MLRVKVTPKGGQPMELDFDKPVLRIGRSPDSDIQLPQNAVSKHHATLRVGPHGPVLVDEGSTNGTYVGVERLVGERAVGASDVIHIGDFTLVLIPLGDPGPTQVLSLGAPSASARPSAPRGPQVTVNPYRRREE
jgi:pSer/pThr/pTyr-binding forkhead associated (FHA) protein